MKPLLLILALVSTNTFSEEKKLLNCNFQTKQGAKEINLVLDTKNNYFKIIETTAADRGFLIIEEDFYRLKYISGGKISTKSFDAVINRHERVFTIEFEVLYRSITQNSDSKDEYTHTGSCDEKPYKQVL